MWAKRERINQDNKNKKCIVEGCKYRAKIKGYCNHCWQYKKYYEEKKHRYDTKYSCS